MILRRTLLATCLALALPAASANGAITSGGNFVAVGIGTPTHCSVSVDKDETTSVWAVGPDKVDFHGSTTCNRPIQQMGHAWVPDTDDPTWDGGTCSGFLASCWSGDFSDDWADDVGGYGLPARYEVELIAPFGQGWVGAPVDCSGVGSDRLNCLFVSDPINVPGAT